MKRLFEDYPHVAIGVIFALYFGLVLIMAVGYAL